MHIIGVIIIVVWNSPLGYHGSSAMERMLGPTCTCPGIIPDLESIPIKLRSALLSFSYDPEIYSDLIGSLEKFVQVQFACAVKCYTLCVIKGSTTERRS